MTSRGFSIQGLQEFILDYRGDSRGGFVKTYHEEIFRKADIQLELKEQYYTVSEKDVVRGMHFQVPPFACAKLVTVISGEILDIVLDLRKQSLTYGQWVTIPMSSETPSCLFIPEGCAHGFLSLQNHTCMLYNASQIYNFDCDTGIRWDSFGFQWPVEHPNLSQRDQKLVPFDMFHNPF